MVDKAVEYKGFLVTLSDADTDKLDKAWEGAKRHWHCLVYDKINRKQMGFDVFGGSMAKMNPLEALYYFCNDAYTYTYFSDIKDLMNEYGYDYSEAKKVYNGLEKAYYKCRKFIGNDNDILEIVNELEKKWG